MHFGVKVPKVITFKWVSIILASMRSFLFPCASCGTDSIYPFPWHIIDMTVGQSSFVLSSCFCLASLISCTELWHGSHMTVPQIDSPLVLSSHVPCDWYWWTWKLSCCPNRLVPSPAQITWYRAAFDFLNSVVYNIDCKQSFHLLLGVQLRILELSIALGGVFIWRGVTPVCSLLERWSSFRLADCYAVADLRRRLDAWSSVVCTPEQVCLVDVSALPSCSWKKLLDLSCHTQLGAIYSATVALGLKTSRLPSLIHLRSV
jgi:hypothetical protein